MQRKSKTKRLPKKEEEREREACSKKAREKAVAGGGKGKRVMDGPEVGPLLACRGNKDEYL